MSGYQYIHGGEVVLEPGRDGVVRPRYRGGRWLKFGVPVSSGAYKALLHSLGKSEEQVGDIIPIGDLYAKVLLESDKPKLVTAFVTSPESEPEAQAQEKGQAAQPAASAPKLPVDHALQMVEQIFVGVYTKLKPLGLSEQALVHASTWLTQVVFGAIWHKDAVPIQMAQVLSGASPAQEDAQAAPRPLHKRLQNALERLKHMAGADAPDAPRLLDELSKRICHKPAHELTDESQIDMVCTVLARCKSIKEVLDAIEKAG
jgi:hypothetical protein